MHSRHSGAGAAVEVLIRPENVRIVAPGEAVPEENVLDGVVRQLSFVGGRTRVEAMFGEQCLLASRVSARDEAAIQPGEPVRMAWSQANSVVLD